MTTHENKNLHFDNEKDDYMSSKKAERHDLEILIILH